MHSHRPTGNKHYTKYDVYSVVEVGTDDTGYHYQDDKKIGQIEVVADEIEYNSGAPHAFTEGEYTDQELLDTLVDAELLSSNSTLKGIGFDHWGQDTINVINKFTDETVYILKKV